MTMGRDPFMIWRSIGDTDDATRLLQVRALLDGAGWYNTVLLQLGIPEPVTSHWSRLVDLPQAALLFFFELFVDGRTADTLLRAIWPLPFLFAMMAIAAGEAGRRGGRLAFAMCLFLGATSGYATFQFMPGRIDHHNIQILGVAGGLLLMFRALLMRRGGYAAGALMGTALAVGFEAMPLVMALLALSVLIAAVEPRLMKPVANVLITMAGVLFAVVALTEAPSRWLVPACDAVGSNLVVLTSLGALTVFATVRFGGAWSPLKCLVVLGLGGALALGAYAAFNPNCLAGPMAAVDPAIRGIWLAHVTEGMSLAQFFAKQPAIAIVYVLTVGAALFLSWLAYRKHGGGARLFVVLTFALAGLYGTIFVKFFPYAIWLALPTIAVALSRLPALGETPARTVRLAGLVTCNHVTLMIVGAYLAGAIVPSVQANTKREAAATKKRQCTIRSDFEKLAALRAGRVMNDINIGPNIALHTEHRVLVAPYHRIDRSIVLWHTIRTANLEMARKLLETHGIDYVMLCGELSRTASATARPSHRFEDYILAGGQAAFLKPITVHGLEAPLRIWRVIR